ncbi:hypothetical protein [Mycobacterium seoulense]|uniref:hypothetical protein n=1 Tax=Mycobacterium seoulense TaxID=386911 RepID=UPI003CF2C5A0
MTERKLTVEQGYENLSTRIASDVRSLEAIEVEPGSPVSVENAFLAPVYRPFALCTKQSLGSALDHLELVAETLNTKGEPHPFAEATLIRTAITAASYALWMLSGDSSERRYRALQFAFKDYDGWSSYVRTEGQNPEAPDPERYAADTAIAIAEFDRRRNWIVDQANILKGESWTVRQFRDRLPSDTAVVEQAGARVLGPWRFLSGYAHGLPWATIGNQVPLSDPDPETGAISVSQRGNPEQLLDAAFYTIAVIERATAGFRSLCRAETPIEPPGQ